MRRITKKSELVALAAELGVRSDWHEPDEQDVEASVHGRFFGNDGFWADHRSHYMEYEEQHVVLYQSGRVVAAVNLATLFAWATGLED